jgi:hypothetical protein
MFLILLANHGLTNSSTIGRAAVDVNIFTTEATIVLVAFGAFCLVLVLFPETALVVSWAVLVGLLDNVCVFSAGCRVCLVTRFATSPTNRSNALETVTALWVAQ